eukprot:jgi/Chlat1/3605/Chrsp234S03576
MVLPAMVAWFLRLHRTFGLPFLLLIIAIYWTQGFKDFAWLGVTFLLKDALALRPTAAQLLHSTAFLPWSIKPIYGVLSDCLPIWGSRRISYIVIGAVLSAASWLALAVMPALRSSAAMLLLMLVLGNVGAALSDVVIDAMIAQATRSERAEFAGDLQSLSWITMSVGGLLGAISGGVAMTKLDVKVIFGVFALFPMFGLVVTPFVPDDNVAAKSQQSSPQWEPTAYHHAVHLSDEDEELGVLYPNRRGRKGVVSVVIAHLRRLVHAIKDPHIFWPLLWFFGSNCVVPRMPSAMFYFWTNELRLDASFVGLIKTVGWAALMVGTAIYNRHLKRTPLRKVFRWAHVAMACCTVLDLLLVLRLNPYFGIPDKLFVLASSASADAIAQFKFMPFLVLSARLCPPGLEGTLFALFMSISNFGSTLSNYNGAFLAHILHITQDNFQRLPLAIMLQAVSLLLPILFLRLIPNTVNSDDTDDNNVENNRNSKWENGAQHAAAEEWRVEIA